MDLRLFSIEQTPKALPVWETILQDLGAPSAPRIARALDVGTSTVYRWNQTGQAPRMACLALFWLTRWGRSEIDARATNDAMTAAALARSLGEERNALRGRVAVLTDERDRLSQVVQRFQALADRGSAATADHSRTDTAPAATSALAWPELVPLALAWPELPAPTPAVHPSADGRGTPAAPRPAAHSARCPDRPHTDQPRLSEPQEVVPWSPLAHPRCQSDATMPPSADSAACRLLNIRQAQGAAAGSAPAGGGWRHPAPGSAAAATPLPLAPGQLHEVADAPWPSWRAGAGSARPALAHAQRHLGPASAPTPDVARPGIPASAARPERPASMGHGPIPRALGAPGPGVFAAMASALAPSHDRPGCRWPAESERLDRPTSATE